MFEYFLEFRNTRIYLQKLLLFKCSSLFYCFYVFSANKLALYWKNKNTVNFTNRPVLVTKTVLWVSYLALIMLMYLVNVFGCTGYWFTKLASVSSKNTQKTCKLCTDNQIVDMAFKKYSWVVNVLWIAVEVFRYHWDVIVFSSLCAWKENVSFTCVWLNGLNSNSLIV